MRGGASASYIKEVEAAGSQKALAQCCGVSEPFFSDVLRGRRERGEKLLTALGCRRVVSDEPIAAPEGK